VSSSCGTVRGVGNDVSPLKVQRALQIKDMLLLEKVLKEAAEEAIDDEEIQNARNVLVVCA
jgi:hypothetical protein